LTAQDANALMAILRARSSSAAVQTGCCELLSDLRLEGDAAADAINAIVAALLRHGVDHAMLQRIGCRALFELMQRNADNRVFRLSTAAASHAVETVVVAGLRAHPADAGVAGLKAARCSCISLRTART
jgi:hypothetical protein